VARSRYRVVAWRREALRTNLWLVPSALVGVGVLAFVCTYAIDRAAANGSITLPNWIASGSADAARQVLIGIAAAVVTVAGVVFSITILALQLASQQFGPRMLRNFIRDRGTQVTLGIFMATVVFSILAVGSVGTTKGYAFVPHLTVGVALVLTLIALGVLIYFIHHVAMTIQLTSVVSAIARDFSISVGDLRDEATALEVGRGEAGPSRAEIERRLEENGAIVVAADSGFLQAVGHDRLVQIASSSGAVIRLLHRPGHFVVEGLPLAVVWPADAMAPVGRALHRAHVIGAHRTLTQDAGFALDQLVEIALRALSPAVNDTFTALNCIDWLGASLCEVTVNGLPDGVYRDSAGDIRLIDPVITYARLVKGAHDKVRQAGRGMPAVLIRQLENLGKVMALASTAEQRDVLLRHGALVMEMAEASVPDGSDLQDVRAAYEAVLAAA